MEFNWLFKNKKQQTETEMNHAERQQQHQQYLTREVMRILELNDEQYQVLRFESAFPYLDRVTDSNSAIIAQLTNETNSMFWKWWINQYTLIDEVFISRTTNHSFMALGRNKLRIYYSDMHVNMVAIPDSILYRHHEEYSKMMIKTIEKLSHE